VVAALPGADGLLTDQGIFFLQVALEGGLQGNPFLKARFFPPKLFHQRDPSGRACRPWGITRLGQHFTPILPTLVAAGGGWFWASGPFSLVQVGLNHRRGLVLHPPATQHALWIPVWRLRGP